MTIKTLTIGPGKLSFGATTSLTRVEAQVTKCTIKPSAKQGDPIPVLSGERVEGDRTEAATLEFSILQDLGDVTSFVEWTWKNAGKSMPFEFIPESGKGKAVRGNCTIERSDIGGEVGSKATADLSFQCTTMPTIESEIIGG